MSARVLDVTAFGADPTGRRDSAAAVRAALEAARGGPAVVRFPRGRYDVWPDEASVRELYVSNTGGDDPRYRLKRIGVLVEGLSDLVVDGDGSTLVLHGLQTALAVVDGARVTVRDLEVDYASPTVVDATVVASGVSSGRAFREIGVPEVTGFRVEGTSVVWEGEPTGPAGEPCWTGRDGLGYCQVLDPRTGLTTRTGDVLFADVARVTATGRRRLRVEYRHGDDPDDTGAVYQLRATTRDHPGIAVVDSTEVVFERLTVRYLHGFGLVAQGGRDLVVRGCEFAPPPGTGRHTAGFADFLHCSGVSGRLEVRDCLFSGAHDDAVNVHGTYLRVVGAGCDGRLDLEFAHPETAGLPLFAPGDELEVVDAATLTGGWGRFRALRVDGPSGRDHDRPLRRMSVWVDGALPDLPAGAGLVVENVTRTPSVEITGCTFRAVPTRGVLVTTRRPVRIAGCTFVRIPMACVLVAGDATQWYESGPVTDVLVEHNRFVEPGAAVVAVDPTVAVADPDRPVHGTVTLRDNEVVADHDVVLVEAHGLARLVVAGTRLPDGVRAVLRTDGAVAVTAGPEVAVVERDDG